MTLKDRFDQANTTNDGHLTLDQAKAGLPRVAKNFAAIDKDNKGYVTLTDIHDYYKAQRAARRQTQNNNG
jgi:Ca2+-binding EF-hand superfamily protein